MTKNCYIIISLLFVLCACGKYDRFKQDDPTRNAGHLFGRLFLTDTLTQRSIDVPLAKKKITVSFAGAPDTLNYLYSTTTNEEGYFQFPALNMDRKYRVAYEETVDGKLYFGTSESGAPNDYCIVRAALDTVHQRGLLLFTADKDGNPLAGVDICLFTSREAFGKGTCEGSNYQLKTNAHGRVSQFGVAAGMYFIRAKITVNGTVYVAEAQQAVDAKVARVALTMAVPPVSPVNGLDVLVTDEEGNALNGAQVCLFTSRVLFSRDTCDGANYSLPVNTEGKAAFSGLPAQQKFYVMGNLQVKGLHLQARDSVVIGDQRKSLHLRMKKI